MSRLLHIVTVNLRSPVDGDAITRAVELAHGLQDAEGAQSVHVGRSDTHLVVATWLADRAQLEPFAASEPHMAFVMRGLARVTDAMWSAAVETEAEPPPAADALWAFALRASDGVYEWQVQEMLASVERLPGIAACGPTFEERDRYRAAGIVSLAASETAAFEAALTEARETWGELAPSIEAALAPSVTRSAP